MGVARVVISRTKTGCRDLGLRLSIILTMKIGRSARDRGMSMSVVGIWGDEDVMQESAINKQRTRLR